MVRTRKRNYDEIQKGGGEEDDETTTKQMIKKRKSGGEEGEGSGKSYVRRRIYMPVETLLQVLSCIRRIELNSRVSMSSRRLCSLAHIILFEKCKCLPGTNERSLGLLRIVKSDSEERGCILLNGHQMDLPADNCFVPDNIVRFYKIVIRHIDERALQFLHKISRSFVAVKLGIGWGDSCKSVALQHILPLCKSIQSLRCPLMFICAIQSNFPALLAQCQMLKAGGGVPLLAKEVNDVLAVLLQWFSTGRADGRPKVARLSGDLVFPLIGSLEKQFADATAPSPFIFRIIFYVGFGPMPIFGEHPPMQNLRTAEQFAVQINRCEYDERLGEVMITRCALSMPQAVQQQFDECMQKLIGGGWFRNDQKMFIY